MTIGQALHGFYSSFELPAYPITSVPKTAELPYITYSTAGSAFEDTVLLDADIWFRTESESVPNEKAEEIAEYIGRGGIVLPITDGYIWMKKGSPFWQPIADPDNTIKRRHLLFAAEFLK